MGSEHLIDGKVVPYYGGRKCTDTREWRDATELEIQQAASIAELEARAEAAEAALAECQAEADDLRHQLELHRTMDRIHDARQEFHGR